MTWQLLSFFYFDGRSRTRETRTEGEWTKLNRQNYDTRQNLHHLWTKLWAITAMFLNIYTPGVLLLVRLLILLELLTLKTGALNFSGYQSISRNNPAEIKLHRKTSSGCSTDCLFRCGGQKLIRGRYTPVIPRERWKGWRLASLLWVHNGVGTRCRRRTNVFMTVQQRLRC